MQRVFLALIPVMLLTTASLALPGLTPEPLKIFTPASAPVAQAPAPSTAPVIAPSAATPFKGRVLAQATQQQSSEVAQETPVAAPLPQLVVDKTQLVEAMSFLVRATEQAKLSLTALDAQAQRLYIQETINLIAGEGDAHFRLVTTSAGTYPGTVALLSQALQAREQSEATYLAEIQKLSGEVAGAGGAATNPNVIPMLGTRGLRPEEQTSQLIERALIQAVQALAVAQAKPEAGIYGKEADAKFASDEATAIMESVVKMLESALKIVQIAIDR